MNVITKAFASEPWQKLRALSLPRDNMLGGVCAGLGRATPLAPWMWRILFIMTTCVWGFGLVAYLALVIAVPEEE